MMLPALLGSCKSENENNDNKPVMKDPERGVEFADPFIMYDNGKYYAYGTMADNGIAVYTSDDLKYWEPAGMALHKDNSYADRWFWAPEIYKVGDRYLMYYSADEHICVAEATKSIGPFKQQTMRPMLDEKCIDNSLFIDSDGTPYLYFDRFVDGLSVHVAKLSDDLLTIDPTTITRCIGQSQDWERMDGSVNEGSFVMKHGDKYYLTYSGNGYTSPNYGLGVAIADSPMGPWTKYEGNPIFQFPQTKEYGRLDGVGHSAMFTDKDGNLRIVFHAHKKPGTVHPREMYISTVSFTDDAVPLMQISSSDIIKCALK